MRGKRSEKSVRSCRKTEHELLFWSGRRCHIQPGYPRGVKCRVVGLAEVQLWLLTTFFYGTYAKIKEQQRLCWKMEALRIRHVYALGVLGGAIAFEFM